MSKLEFPRHTASEEWLAAYSAGALSEAKRLVIECQMAMKPALAARILPLDHIGGAFIESSKGEALSGSFSARLSEAIARAETAPPRAGEAPDAEEGADELGAGAWAPGPLSEFLKRSEIEVKWRNSGPGVARAVLFEAGGERLYLLKARPGLKMPVHSHSGQEWTLVLQGGYHAGPAAFGRGDLHCEDESCTHRPVIDDDGEDCISLVVDEGPLVFRDPVLRLIQPLIGI
jgi:putative transcriptional regulator